MGYAVRERERFWLSQFHERYSSMAYENILVALDISDEAGEVLDSAKKMMADERSKISIVNVIRPMTGFYVDVYAVLGDQSRIESQAIEHASLWLAQLSEHHGIDAHTIDIILGRPATEIRRKAEEISADVIVLGTHGRHGLGRMLGSTANGVLHGAPCDVLAVRVRREPSQGA
jgi:universal stress protein A